MDDDALAKLAYEAYVDDAGGLNYQGKPCPKWDDLPEAIRQHWKVAVQAVRGAVEDQVLT